MPGLFGVVSATVNAEQLMFIYERIRQVLSVNDVGHCFVEDALISPPFLVGYHSISKLTTQKGVIQDGSIAMAFDGVTFEPSLSTAQLLSQYLKQDVRFVRKLRGNFALAVCYGLDGDLYLFTDHAGTRPIYYAIQEDILYFAGDYMILSAILSEVRESNDQAVVDMLTFGYMVGDKTPKVSIQLMPAGNYLHFNVHTSELEIKTYFVTDVMFSETSSYSEIRDELQRFFVQAVERTLQGTKPIFTLSGGLDSRAILAAALQAGVKYPDCLIFGEPASLDIKSALKVAHEAKAQAILVSLGFGDYLSDTFETASQYNGGMVYYSGSAHMLYALQRLNFNQWNIVQTGMSGDMLMGSFLHKAEINETVKSDESVIERIIEQFGQMLWLEKLISDRVAAYELLKGSVRDSLREITPGQKMSRVLELWNLHNRQQRGMFNGFRMIENFAEYSSPFFDADLYEFTLRIPHRYRLGEAIYIDMLSRLIPTSMWRVAWQKTGFPPSTHRKVNKFNAWRTLWFGRAKQVLFPSIASHMRSMNPMGAWLRGNERLREFAVETLLNWEAVPQILDQDKVHDFARDIADNKIGLTRRVPNLLFRLLTIASWGRKP